MALNAGGASIGLSLCDADKDEASVLHREAATE